MPAAHRGRAVGTDLRMGVMQLFSLIQLLALSFATMLLAHKGGGQQPLLGAQPSFLGPAQHRCST